MCRGAEVFCVCEFFVTEIPLQKAPENHEESLESDGELPVLASDAERCGPRVLGVLEWHGS
jgi:hypothetical protein